MMVNEISLHPIETARNHWKWIWTVLYQFDSIDVCTEINELDVHIGCDMIGMLLNTNWHPSCVKPNLFAWMCINMPLWMKIHNNSVRSNVCDMRQTNRIFPLMFAGMYLYIRNFHMNFSPHGTLNGFYFYLDFLFCFGCSCWNIVLYIRRCIHLPSVCYKV